MEKESNTAEKEVKVTINTYSWDNSEKNIAEERRICSMVEEWAKELPPPISFQTDPCDGYRVFIRPDHEESDDKKRALVRWFVRMSGKRFIRFFREEGGTVSWWNNEGYSDEMIPNNENFEDKKGDLKALFLIENMAVGKCKVVKVEKTIMVSKLVCGDE